MIEALRTVPWLGIGLWLLHVSVALVASIHALLNKRSHRAAVLWVALICTWPIVGAALYVLLGINRIRRRARQARSERPAYPREPPPGDPGLPDWPPAWQHLAKIAQVVGRLVRHPLTGGNAIEPLIDGEQAYPAMLEAIADARTSVTLVTYIFGNDAVGARFVAALAAAQARGVEVRVLIDDLGSRYGYPPVTRELARAGVRHRTFLPILQPRQLTFFNLRNHRKALVVDGAVGFTGGMNISLRHMVGQAGAGATQDVHFRVRGPVVAHLQHAFAEDWHFVTGESLLGATWFPPLAAVGPSLARGITDGPDEDVDNLHWTLLAAVGAARRRVRVVTPYFLPDATLMAALNLAAMRGVEVTVVLPERSNLPYVHWATFAILWQILRHGCRVFLTPPPFDHSKLMVVDDEWSLVGSTNWDPRALRLNFELNLECYGPELTSELHRLIDRKLAAARELTLADVDGRSLPVRIRDGLARLFIPFL